MVGHVGASLTPLHCRSCNAPLAIGIADAVECPHCHTANDVPEDVRALRTTATADSEARDRAAAIINALGSPPSAAARFLVRSAGVLVIIAAILIVIPVALVIGVISSSWTPFGMQLYDTLSAKQQTALGVSSPVVFLVVGLLLVGAARRHAIEVGKLKAALAAKPPSRQGGTAQCRVCGAALDYTATDLGARCLYCNAENLLRMPPPWLARMTTYRAGVTTAVDNASVQLAEQRRSYRRSLIQRAVVAAPFLALPVVILWRGCGPPDRSTDDKSTPDWRASLASRGMTVPCTGGAIDLGPVTFTAQDCTARGCLVRRLLPLRRGETLVLATGAPADVARAEPLPPKTGVRIDRHVMQWIGGSDPSDRAWGTEIARVFPQVGQPATWVAPTSGWFRATVAIAGAVPMERYSLCFEIRNAERR